MIKFQNVHKTYKNSGVNALKGVSFLIDDGEFVFIIGKSGAGKSTILKCMDCEESPDEGAVFVDGFNISSMPRALVPVLRRQVAMVFQDFRLIETKTVSENIAFAGEIIGLTQRNLHQKIQLVLNIVGLKDKADDYPASLSGGERQRVAIARAMLNNPKVIVADEPTGNLDPETSENIMGLLLDINRSGTTVIVCTHDSNMVDKMKKRVIEIDNGYVVRDKEGGSYADEEPEEEQQVDSGFAFGDDSDYRNESDEGSYADMNKGSDFFFGETPAAALEAARAEAMRIAAASALKSAPAPAPVPMIPFSDTEDDGYDDEEVAFEDVMTDIADLPVENEVEAAPEEVPSVSQEEPLKLEEDTSATEEIPVEELPVLQETSEETPAEDALEEIPVEQISETSTDEQVPEEDDSWLKEVRMDDIDLDIQEDDE